MLFFFFFKTYSCSFEQEYKGWFRMKKMFFACLVCTLQMVSAQDICVRSILNTNQRLGEKIVSDFLDFDFSPVWNNSKIEVSIGEIGEDQQKMKIKIINVVKNANDAKDYLVFGVSTIDGINNDFSGRIIIQNIQEVINSVAADNLEYKLLSPRTHGIIEAQYVFNQRKGKGAAGYFSGKLTSKWFITQNDTIYYDDSDKASDGYFNNAYVGIWKNYVGNNEKNAYWSDFGSPIYDCSSEMVKTLP